MTEIQHVQTFNSLDISLYIGLATLFALALIWWVYTLGHSHGHDGGYNDGISSGRADQQQRIDALHEDLANLHGKLARAETAHELIMQDADTRIAIYSRRSNPLTRDDAKWLRKVSGQLQLLANMHHNLGAETAENWAHAAVAKANNLAALVDDALDAADGPQPDTQGVDAYVETLNAVGHGNRSWLVYGPQMCGKTRNARALANAFGMPNILDDWNPGEPVPATNTLVLTNSEGPFAPFTRRLLPFHVAMRLLTKESAA